MPGGGMRPAYVVKSTGSVRTFGALQIIVLVADSSDKTVRRKYSM